MTKPKDDRALRALVMEYEGLASIRLQHMGAYVQTNFYFGVLILILGGAITSNIEWVLVIAPLVVFIQMSIVQWNQYHHFLTEEYLCHLERSIRRESGLVGEGVFYHGYYDLLFRHSTHLRENKSDLLPVIKPTALLSTNLAVFNLVVIVFCCVYPRDQFITKFSTDLYVGVVVLYLILLTLLVYNFLMQPKRIRPILKSFLRRQVEENGAEDDEACGIK